MKGHPVLIFDFEKGNFKKSTWLAGPNSMMGGCLSAVAEDTTLSSARDITDPDELTAAQL